MWTAGLLHPSGYFSAIPRRDLLSIQLRLVYLIYEDGSFYTSRASKQTPLIMADRALALAQALAMGHVFMRQCNSGYFLKWESHS
jgi:hypothetical protein